MAKPIMINGVLAGWELSDDDAVEVARASGWFESTDADEDEVKAWLDETGLT